MILQLLVFSYCIGCYWMICHNNRNFGVWRWNLGYFAWGCKCSSGLFRSLDHVLKATRYALYIKLSFLHVFKKNTCCNRLRLWCGYSQRLVCEKCAGQWLAVIGWRQQVLWRRSAWGWTRRPCVNSYNAMMSRLHWAFVHRRPDVTCSPSSLTTNTCQVDWFYRPDTRLHCKPEERGSQYLAATLVKFWLISIILHFYNRKQMWKMRHTFTYSVF